MKRKKANVNLKRANEKKHRFECVKCYRNNLNRKKEHVLERTNYIGTQCVHKNQRMKCAGEKNREKNRHLLRIVCVA